LLGTVEVVPAGVVLLPGVQGLATVAEVPLGRDGVAEATVELELLPVPLLVVADVPGVAVEAVLLGVVEVEVEVSVLVLLDGVHGATVVVAPVWFCVLLSVPPVTDPALPATPGVPCVTAGLPVELGLGCDVGRVPTELGCVVVEPGWVVVVPGCDCVVDVPVCGPIPGLGVTVPVFCAMAMPVASATTDVANRILRIESCSLCTSTAPVLRPLGSFTLKSFASYVGCLLRIAEMSRRSCRKPLFAQVARQEFSLSLQGRRSVGQMRCFASILPPVLKIKCEFLL
jgi:hypothetical protein